MTGWIQLAIDAEHARQCPAILPDDITEETRITLSSFDQYFLSIAKQFLELRISDAGKKQRLRRLLSMRWTIIQRTSLDYTFNPHLPSNQFCVALAKAIRNENESIIQVIMPTITTVLGTTLSSNHILLDVENDGHLALSDFLLHSQNDAVIAVVDLFEIASNEPAVLFLERVNSEVGEYHFSTELTDEDRHILRAVAGEASKEYFDLLQKIYFVKKNKKPSLAFVFESLCAALLKSSEVGNGASGQATAADCHDAISKVYDIWRALPPDIHREIKDFMPKHNMNTSDRLESLLLRLFYETNKTLTMDESILVIEDGVINCTNQIGNILNSILKHHYARLNNIPIPGRESEFESVELPSAEELASAFENLKNAIKKRPCLLGERDYTVSNSDVVFALLTKNNFDMRFEDSEISELANWILTPDDFLCVLQLMQPERWEKLIGSLSRYMKGIIAPDEKAWDSLSFILNQLPPTQWVIFCDALSDVLNVGSYVKPSDLYYLVNEIPESKHHHIQSAFKKLAPKILSSGRQVGSYFRFSIFSQATRYYQYFEEAINAVMMKPDEVFIVYKMNEEDNWHALSCVLSKPLIALFNDPFHHDDIFSHFFKSESKITFLEAFLPVLEEVEWGVTYFKRIISAFLKSEFITALKLIKKSNLIRCIKTVSELRDVLQLFGDSAQSRRIAFVSEVFLSADGIEVDAKSLYELISKFPECKTGLLKAFRKQLVRILSDLATFYSYSEFYFNGHHRDFISHFEFFYHQAFPILFSRSHIESIAPEFFKISHSHYVQQFNEIDLDLKKQGITDEANKIACFKKMELFSKLVKNSSQNGYQLARCAEQLKAYFGADFFDRMLQCRKIDFSTCRLVESVSYPKKMHLSFIHNQGRTSAVSHRPVSAGSQTFFPQRVSRGVPSRVTQLSRRR